MFDEASYWLALSSPEPTYLFLDPNMSILMVAVELLGSDGMRRTVGYASVYEQVDNTEIKGRLWNQPISSETRNYFRYLGNYVQFSNSLGSGFLYERISLSEIPQGVIERTSKMKEKIIDGL